MFAPAPGGDLFYRPGDLVTRDADGLHWLARRTDFQVKVRGVRTHVQEVENALAAHPDVAEAAVVAIPDTEAGCRLHAQVTRRSGTLLASLWSSPCGKALAEVRAHALCWATVNPPDMAASARRPPANAGSTSTTSSARTSACVRCHHRCVGHQDLLADEGIHPGPGGAKIYADTVTAALATLPASAR